MFCLGAGAEHSDSLLVQQLFSSVGYCARVMEAQIGELTQWRRGLFIAVRNIFLKRRGFGEVLGYEMTIYTCH